MRIGRHSYQQRILMSLGLIGLMLLLALTTAYLLSRQATLQQAQNGLATLGHHIEDEINRGAAQLQQQTDILRNHLGLRRKVYSVVRSNRESWSLRNYVQRHFRWLQDHQVILVSRSSEVLVGEHQTELVSSLVSRNKKIAPQDNLTYVQGKKGLMHMSAGPVYYGNRYLGLVAVAQLLDQAWMQRISKAVGYPVVMVVDGKVQISSKSDIKSNTVFSFDDGEVDIAGTTYLAYRLQLNNKKPNAPQLWLLRSRSDALQTMQAQAWWFWLSLAVLVATIIILAMRLQRGLTQPLHNIRRMVEVLKSGHIPKSHDSHADQEFAYIERQFGKLAKTLHNKMHEFKVSTADQGQPVLLDMLTGLGNRSQLSNVYSYQLSRMQRNNSCLAVILVDIDGLRQINSDYSHVVGDHVIMHVASILRSCAAENDSLFRTAGGEFMIMTAEECDRGVSKAEHIRSRLEHSPMKYEDRIIDITASFGVIEVDKLHQTMDLESLMTRAKNAVRSAKASGRNRVAAGNLEVVRDKA